MLRGIRLERIKLVLDLSVNIFILALGFAALSFNDPDRSIFLHHDVVSVEKPLFLNSIYIDDGEVLLSSVTVFVHPFDVLAAFTVLLKQHFTSTANKAGCKTRSIFVIGIR